LRHTYASWALASGAHLATLQKLLGHSDINMMMRYSHTSSQDMVTATENFAALIEQQIAAKKCLAAENGGGDYYVKEL
jgi:integrase